MARPRVFISSTFYDLKQIRSALDVFVREYGFEPVLNEQGNIPYASTESPERGAYREVDLCDILVAIIGGRAGTTSDDGIYSISQRELKRAHEKGKQIYIFVESSVLANYEFYRLNRGKSGIEYSSGSEPIFRFIEEVQSLPQNNALAPFELTNDITRYLREQWAGLFHRLLQENKRRKDLDVEADFRSALGTLRQLVDYLTQERKSSSEVIKDILLSNHPAFADLQKKLEIGHRVIFANKAEFRKLMAVYDFVEEYNPFKDDEGEPSKWTSDGSREKIILDIGEGVFDKDGNLLPRNGTEWDSNLFAVHTVKKQAVPADEYDPFKDE